MTAGWWKTLSPGKAFEHAALTPNQAETVLVQLAESLRRAHTIETSGFGILTGARLQGEHATLNGWLQSCSMASRKHAGPMQFGEM